MAQVDLSGLIDRGATIASPMPTISSFYRIMIRMFFHDHAPPHFHVRYGEFEATIYIDTLEIIEGKLPQTALRLVEWG